MEPRKYNTKFLRQRKFLLIAPAGAVVLLTILFSALGGGRGLKQERQASSYKGINVSLPTANFKEDKPLDKTAYYKRAEIDSLNLEQKQKNQGWWAQKTGSAGRDSPTVIVPDSNVEKVNHRIAEVRNALKQAPAASPYGPAPYPILSERRPSVFGSSDIDRLERLLKGMKDGESGPNPELKDLNKTLDKLILVQHPDRAMDTSERKRNPGVLKPLPVSAAMAGETMVNWKAEAEKANRFYDLETSGAEEGPEISGIEAVVPETQTLVNGGLMRLELATELIIKGNHIARGTPLYGIAHLNGERLLIAITSIRCQNHIYPVALQVVDQDGLQGIYEPGSVSRDAARESAGETINGIGPTSLDPSIGAQVASGAIQMARSLTGKKIKLIRVTVKSGYRVFLKDVSSPESR